MNYRHQAFNLLLINYVLYPLSPSSYKVSSNDVVVSSITAAGTTVVKGDDPGDGAEDVDAALSPCGGTAGPGHIHDLSFCAHVVG
jgi:hypothetical protein